MFEVTGIAGELRLPPLVSDQGVAALSLPAEARRTDLRLLPDQTRELRIPSGNRLNVSFETKCASGAPQLGLAFDYLANKPVLGFGPDDDTSYQIIGLVSLEKYGPDLSALQIGKEWVELAPQGVDTMVAEGQALKRLRSGIAPPLSGQHRIGEAIGGQMRGEIWGLVAPGRPDLAAEYARRDALVSHYGNGVYGEQFISAMIASSFYEKDVATLIQIGLKYIPADSKYAQVVRFAIELHNKYPDFHDALKELRSRYVFLSEVDLFADAGIVTLALLYGGGDFERTILIAAACGNDTDTDTATVGALLGCILGADALPAK